MNKKVLKFVSILMILCLAVSLSGCGAKSKVPDTYDMDLSKYVKLGPYEGLEYEKLDRTVTDQEVQDEIDYELSFNAERKEINEGTVAGDSIVNIDFEGSVNGVVNEDMCSEDEDIDIANSGMIEGFAEGIVGHDVGETFDIQVTFPDDYYEESLQGVDAVFTIKVNYLIDESLRELTDDYVKSNTEYSTVDEYKAAIREQLETEKAENADDHEQGEVFQQIVEGSEIIEFPEEIMTEKHDQMIAEYQEYADMYGLEYSEFLEQFVGTDEAGFEEQVNTIIENTVTQELVLHALAKELGIKVSNKEYSDFLDGLLEEAGLDRESFEEESGQTIDEYAEDYNLYESYLYQLVMEEVMKRSVAK